jgi:membrane protein
VAQLSDVPKVLRAAGPVPFLKRIVREIVDDNLFTLAGGLAYSWLFAIFPFLVFLMNLFPLFARGHEQATKEGMRVFLFAALPDAAARILWEQMERRITNIVNDPNLFIASVSLLVALWAASKGVGVTMAAMEKCYELEKGRAFYTRRPMAFGLTLMLSGLVMVLVLLLPAGASFKAWITGGATSTSARAGVAPGESSFPGTPATQPSANSAHSATQPTTHPAAAKAKAVEHALAEHAWALRTFDVVRGLLAILVVLLILGLLYHFGPGVKHRWRYLTPGSVFVLASWVFIALAFRYYVNHFGQSKYQETYGSVGGVAILLLLFYLDALILLIGAQINSEIDFDVLQVPRGSRNFRLAERRVAGVSPAASPAPATPREIAKTPDGNGVGADVTISHGAD